MIRSSSAADELRPDIAAASWRHVHPLPVGGTVPKVVHHFVNAFQLGTARPEPAAFPLSLSACCVSARPGGLWSVSSGTRRRECQKGRGKKGYDGNGTGGRMGTTTPRMCAEAVASLHRAIFPASVVLLTELFWVILREFDQSSTVPHSGGFRVTNAARSRSMQEVQQAACQQPVIRFSPLAPRPTASRTGQRPG